MIPMKIDLTDELASNLMQMRLNNPVKGEILTAEKLSKIIGYHRAWMSQIESRRLKKIKREDIIKIYSILFNCEEDVALELVERNLCFIDSNGKKLSEDNLSKDSYDGKNITDILAENILLKQENEMLKKKLQSIMEIINI